MIAVLFELQLLQEAVFGRRLLECLSQGLHLLLSLVEEVGPWFLWVLLTPMFVSQRSTGALWGFDDAEVTMLAIPLRVWMLGDIGHFLCQLRVDVLLRPAYIRMTLC